jgi:glycyl-tRNA synthetase alpha chain
MNFQNIILYLQSFWANYGCVIVQPYDIEVGAGTFHPETVFRAVGDQEWKCAFVQISRRPSDGRYGNNPNRLQKFHQFQVTLKPSPNNAQDLVLQTFAEMGIDSNKHDIRFVEDNWESPTLGAAGIGWEVWIDGMEALQFTYFQQFAGQKCNPVTVELTYGLERIAMCLQKCTNVYDLNWNDSIKYGAICHEVEKQFSKYNFECANTEQILQHFNDFQKECLALLNQGLFLPAYEQCAKASHAFNTLEARGSMGTAERYNFIQKIRSLVNLCVNAHLNQSNTPLFKTHKE